MLVLMRSSSGCNMRCSYCYGSHGGEGNLLGLEDCRLLLARLRETGCKGKVEFLWHGGEPGLLEPELFEKMLLLLNGLREDGAEVSHSMQSNGLALGQTWAGILKKHDVHVGISLDGPPHIHDSQRRLPDGGGTYALIRKNLDDLVRENVPVSLLATVGLVHVGRAREMADWLAELNLPIRFNPLFAKGRSRERLPLRDYYEFLKEIFTLVIERNLPTPIQPLEWMLKSVLFGAPARECSFSGACGKDIFSFGKGGDTAFCTRDSVSRGNLAHSSLAEIRGGESWRQRMARGESLRKRCGKCGVFNFCHGGCPESFGEIPLAENCEAVKGFFHWLSTTGTRLYLEALVARKRQLDFSLKNLRKIRATLVKSDV